MCFKLRHWARSFFRAEPRLLLLSTDKIFTLVSFFVCFHSLKFPHVILLPVMASDGLHVLDFFFFILARLVTPLTLKMTANWGSFPGERCWTTPKRSFLLPACEIGRHNQRKIVELPDGRCQKNRWGGLGCCLPLVFLLSSFYSFSFLFLKQETIYLNVRGQL